MYFIKYSEHNHFITKKLCFQNHQIPILSNQIKSMKYCIIYFMKCRCFSLNFTFYIQFKTSPVIFQKPLVIFNLFRLHVVNYECLLFNQNEHYFHLTYSQIFYRVYFTNQIPNEKKKLYVMFDSTRKLDLIQIHVFSNCIGSEIRCISHKLMSCKSQNQSIFVDFFFIR